MDDLGFGLVSTKKEGAAIKFDPLGSYKIKTAPSTWMELHIPDSWTEEQIIQHVKEWIRKDRFPHG